MKLYLSRQGFTRLATIVMSCAVGWFAASNPVFASAPSEPGLPSAQVNGNTVSLSWAASTDNIGVAGYNVYQNNRYLTTVQDNRYSGQINASVTNQFYIVAFDNPTGDLERLFSGRSATVTVPAKDDSDSTDNTVPTAPSELIAQRTSSTTVSLTWVPSSDDVEVLGYNVYRNNEYISTVSSPGFNDSQLEPGVEYTYYIVAFDQPRNFSARSLEARTSGEPPADPPDDRPPTDVPDTQRPSVVVGLTQVESSTGVAISWSAGSDNVGVEGYNVYRDQAYLTTVFTNAFRDSSPPDQQRVDYSVTAFDAARNYSVISETLSVVLNNGPEEPPVDDDKGNPPDLRDPMADPIPSPPIADPFGSLLEIDNETAVAGGPPTQPKNLRAELVSNNWAEINWAPANDDGEVVEYRVYRSDGVIYNIRQDTTDPDSGAQAEIDRYWNSTLFLDCNFTRFDTRVHNCRDNLPKPGDEFTYEVSAIDDEGQESARSEPLEVIYHLSENAPIPFYDDFFKLPDDRFVQEHDLSRVRYFIDDFETVFVDDFNGTQINDAFWNTSLIWGDTRIINAEQQYFVDTQRQTDFGYNPFNLTGDTLIIESIATPEELKANLPAICDEADPLGKDRCAFLSGALSSHDKFGLTYGYVESRMKVGSAAGSLSSFYLYHRYRGTDVNLHAPEIDIVEYLGENPFGEERAFQTYHYANVNDGSTNSAPTMSYNNPDGTRFDEDFHTFGVLWEPQLVIWYVDGREIKRMTGPQVGRRQMNIVAYLVSGSAWAPTPDVDADIFPLQFEIDYIKAYQRPPYNTNGLYPDRQDVNGTNK